MKHGSIIRRSSRLGMVGVLVAAMFAGAPTATLAATRQLTVALEKPKFTSPTAIWAMVWVPVIETVRATGYPVPKITLSGPLPPGVTITDNGDGTATISGSLQPSIPVLSSAWDLFSFLYREYTADVTATNSVGSTTIALTFHVFLS
jgi:hypothetical protein